MSRFPYDFFNEYVVRTPLFSRKSFQEQLNQDEISDVKLKEIVNNPVFKESIYLASSNLYEEFEKWLNSEKQFSPKEHHKLKNTLLKYYSRMSTRCTPFGLFSGIGLGKFSVETSNLSNHKTGNQLPADQLLRDTKLDMHLLVSLAQYFTQLPIVKNKLLFSPNNTIYTIGHKIRYIEYQYTGGKREYIISSAPISAELQQIINFSERGKTISEISHILINEEITENDAREFVEELIENQVLVSELEPNVSGTDFLNAIITVLNRLGIKNETEMLVSLKNKLEKLDLNIGNPTRLYDEIREIVQSLTMDYEQKYLFQTDLYNKSCFYLSTSWKKEIKKGISFLNKITLEQKETQFSKFKKAFTEKFDAQEMPLLYVLDTEIGIGYKQNVSPKGIHPYIEDLALPTLQEKQNKKIEFTPVQIILNKKLQEALLDSQYSIKLTDADFEGFEENWDNMPDTTSIMAEIISENHQEKIFLNASTGSSAGTLLGRFCSEKSEVQNLLKNIAKKEEELRPDEILAEIIHLPEARIGNIIRRPTLRAYEIPYLAQSLLPAENQISTEDLYISLKNDEIILRSKKLNKRVIPYLTNAHNYYTNTLPVYHFLSDLHAQHIRPGLYFNWGDLEYIYTFLPRIEYHNIILSKARWKITEKDIFLLDQLKDNKKDFLEELKSWRNKRKIPNWIQWSKFDNTLTMTLENYDMAKLFIQTVKSEKSIIIEEFLYDENDHFRREFIFPMYKAIKDKNK
ncbi:lantibiotic dehydratase family protein [Chryseobacterium sp. Marseille-Q8038]